MFCQASWVHVDLAVSKPPELHESVRGSPGWCIQRQVCVKCLLLQTWCVILKKNNNLATPRFFLLPNFPSDGCLDWGRGGGGDMTQAVDSMAAHPSVLLSLLLFLLLLLLFLLVLLLLLFFSSCPSDVPLHVQGQVVRPGETPVEKHRNVPFNIQRKAWNMHVKWELGQSRRWIFKNEFKKRVI